MTMDTLHREYYSNSYCKARCKKRGNGEVRQYDTLGTATGGKVDNL